jgi:hypothetical protein
MRKDQNSLFDHHFEHLLTVIYPKFIDAIAGRLSLVQPFLHAEPFVRPLRHALACSCIFKHETCDTVPLTGLPPSMFTLSSDVYSVLCHATYRLTSQRQRHRYGSTRILRFRLGRYALMVSYSPT